MMLDVITKMTGAFGEPPSVADVAEVIGLALPVGDDRLALSIVPSAVVVRSAGEGARARLSRVGQLDDAAFVLAARLVSELLAAEDVDGPVMTDSRLASILLSLLRQVPPQLLADSVSEVEALEIVGPRARKRPKRGDVVAVPGASGGFHLAVVLTKNRFGVAYGFFTRRWAALRLPPHLEKEPLLSHAVYAGDRAVMTGRWIIVGHDEAFCRLFPSEPEIYHRLGIAETADGTTRSVPEDELQRVGVLDGSYSQIYEDSELEHQLDQGSLLSR
ncbi:hypothetical protein ACIA5C_48205 [Actinoplanes sp. NPDC051343]|uniref:hypothetical protein n=1 Tax=Actinoplanes sp. NPDC051343 TaxID=3363906 RepID=UPI0037A916EF